MEEQENWRTRIRGREQSLVHSNYGILWVGFQLRVTISKLVKGLCLDPDSVLWKELPYPCLLNLPSCPIIFHWHIWSVGIDVYVFLGDSTGFIAFSLFGGCFKSYLIVTGLLRLGLWYLGQYNFQKILLDFKSISCQSFPCTPKVLYMT